MLDSPVVRTPGTAYLQLGTEAFEELLEGHARPVPAIKDRPPKGRLFDFDSDTDMNLQLWSEPLFG